MRFSTLARYSAMSTVELLRLFGAKARCWHSREKAMTIWFVLRDRLPDHERDHIRTAWLHCTEDSCDPAELDGLIKQAVEVRTCSS